MSLSRNEQILQTYGGSKALVFLCDLTSLSIDQVNFISCQFFALLLSFLLKGYIKNPVTRLWYCLVCGIGLCNFCFGTQIFHIIISAGLSYIAIRSIKSDLMPWVVLAVSMCYLSFLHIKRQFYETASYALDITGPLMVLTQKVTSLAFSIRDGVEMKKKDAKPPTELQKRYIVDEIPDTVTFCSFVFQFQSMLAGPLVLYRDFMEFIHTQDTPNPFGVVIRKFAASMFFAFMFLKFGPHFYVNIVREKDFYEGASYLYKIFYLTVGTTLERCKYYHAWILADAVCNASGLGYDRVKKTWDLVSNVDAFRFEFGLNLKESLDLWNMGTMKWLRHVVYERSPPHIRTSLVYIVSAIWHGFYPGYYITFFSGALFTYAARAVRRSVRPLCVGSSVMKISYDFLTWLATRLAIAYATFSFVVQDFYPSWNMYIRLYFSIHVLAAFALFLVPPIFKVAFGSPKSQKSSSSLSNGVKKPGNPVTTKSEPGFGSNGVLKLIGNGVSEEPIKNGTVSLDDIRRYDTNGKSRDHHQAHEAEWRNLVINTGLNGMTKLKTG